MAVATSSGPPGVEGTESVRSGLAAGASVRRIEPRVLEPVGFSRRRARAPSPSLAVQRYRKAARGYELWTAFGQAYRQAAVEQLAPAWGSTVLDVGCGTGLNFAGLEEAIGPCGRLIGVDVSPEMLARARERVENERWRNVTLIEAAVEDAALPILADAALMSAVHDILRSPAALANIVRRVRPGGRVVAAGPKWIPWWQPGSFALNSCAWLLNQHYVTTFEGFDAPWTHLARILSDLAVEELFLGAGFIAVGTRPLVPTRRAHRRIPDPPSGPVTQRRRATHGAEGTDRIDSGSADVEKALTNSHPPSGQAPFDAQEPRAFDADHVRAPAAHGGPVRPRRPQTAQAA